MAYGTATRVEEDTKKRRKEQEDSFEREFPLNTKVSSSKDDAEKEASRVSSALRGMRGNAGPQNDREQAKADGARGQRLSPYVDTIGRQLGADFSGIKIHTDNKADELAQGADAKAFTKGRDIYFAKDEYAPETDKGQELLAHELTHTIQQGAVEQQGGGAVDVQQSAPQSAVLRGPKERKEMIDKAAQEFKGRFVRSEPEKSIGIRRVKEKMTPEEKTKADTEQASAEAFKPESKLKQAGGWLKDNWADTASLAAGSFNIAGQAKDSTGLSATGAILNTATGLGSGIQGVAENAKDKKPGHAVASGVTGVLSTAAGGVDIGSAFTGNKTDEEKEKQKNLGVSSAVLSGTSAAINVGVNSYDVTKARNAENKILGDIAKLEKYMPDPQTKKSAELESDINKLNTEISTKDTDIRNKEAERDSESTQEGKDKKEEEIKKLKEERDALIAEKKILEGFRDPGVLRRAIGKKQGANVANTKQHKQSGVGVATSLLGVLGAVAGVAGALTGQDWLKYTASGLGMAAAGINIASRFMVNRNETNNKKKASQTMMNYDVHKDNLVTGDGGIKVDGNWEQEYDDAIAGEGVTTPNSGNLRKWVSDASPGSTSNPTDEIKEAIGKIKLGKNDVKRIIVRAYGYKSGKRAEAFQKMMAEGTQTTP